MQQAPYKVLTEIAEHFGYLHEDGKVNQSKLARESGLPGPTISRIINGGDDWSFSANTATTLMNRFGLTFAEVRGDVPITSLYRNKRNRLKPTEEELQMIRELRALPGPAQQEIKQFIKIKQMLVDDD